MTRSTSIPSVQPGPLSPEQRCAEAACRSCGRVGLALLLDLGAMPLSDGLLTRTQLEVEEPRFPLELAFCNACALVQIIETVPPGVLFGADYPYFSSFSDTLLAHSRTHAIELLERRGLGPGSLVVEVASNDGYFLRTLVERGVPVLGIDPAPGPAAAARTAGVPTREAFFGLELAQRLLEDGTRADVLVANNVLAHATDTNDFVAGIATLLKPGGVAVLEFPYVRELIERVEFDTIYHEHLCYFSLSAATALFARHRLDVLDVQRLDIHGGSLRLTVGHGGVGGETPTAAVSALLEEERTLGLTDAGFYTAFARRVDELRSRLRAMLGRLKAEGSRIAVYGAAAKGTILLNAIDADATIVDFVVDRNVREQGRWVPGVRLPILAPEALLERGPDYALITPWNLAEEIVEQQQAYLEAGGRFIVPVPSPRIVGGPATPPRHPNPGPSVSFPYEIDERVSCPSCDAPALLVFYEVRGVPVHSCRLLASRDEAIGFPTGDLRLGFCNDCGFISNTAFDPRDNRYDSTYEETQGFSPTFNAFARSLAEDLVDRHELEGRTVLEIGCGKAEFLALLCELGNCRGIGLDPGCRPERLPPAAASRLELIADLYDERYAHLAADVVVCRHTLEHIAPVGRFVRSLRRTIGDRGEAIVFFELPDVRRELREGAFWDLYYEHCSYFSAGSLARLFRTEGFEVTDLELVYGGQYIVLTARPSADRTKPRLPLEEDLDALRAEVAAFGRHAENAINCWRDRVDQDAAAGRRIVLWGSGSKGVAFLTTLGLGPQVDAVVDVNPHRQGHYMPSTGHEIIAPATLTTRRPDTVIVMNPLYVDEIRASLDGLGLAPDVVAL